MDQDLSVAWELSDGEGQIGICCVWVCEEQLRSGYDPTGALLDLEAGVHDQTGRDPVGVEDGDEQRAVYRRHAVRDFKTTEKRDKTVLKLGKQISN